ncbi:hypothetical protein ACT691_06000 [Vibrio metschnikovii]
MDDDRLTQWLVLLTHSAGKEGFLLTLVVLIGWTWYRVPECRRQWLDKAMQLGVLLVLAMIYKTGIKHVTQSPRRSH